MRFGIFETKPALPDEPTITPEGTGGGGSSAPAPASEGTPPADPTSQFGTEENFEEFVRNVEARERGETVTESTALEQPDQPTEQEQTTEQPLNPAPDLAAQLAESNRAREALEARLAALEKQQLAPSQEQQPQPSALVEDPEPDPQDYEFGMADAKYIADTARWNSRQEFRAQEEQRATQAQLVAIETSWSQRVNDQKVTERYPDFQEKVVKGADRNEWDLSPIGALLVKNSEYGPDVAYYLASNPEESRRIATMEPYEQLRAIARLEGRFEALASAPKAPAPPAKLVPSAPPPPQQRTRGAGGKFGVDPATEDFSAFSKMADSILAGR